MELKISDHKPVSSLFRADMKVVDPVKYRKIYEEVMKKLDRLENEFLPQVTVETTEILFETIKFMEPQYAMRRLITTPLVWKCPRRCAAPAPYTCLCWWPEHSQTLAPAALWINMQSPTMDKDECFGNHICSILIT